MNPSTKSANLAPEGDMPQLQEPTAKSTKSANPAASQGPPPPPSRTHPPKSNPLPAPKLSPAEPVNPENHPQIQREITNLRASVQSPLQPDKRHDSGIDPTELPLPTLSAPTIVPTTASPTPSPIPPIHAVDTAVPTLEPSPSALRTAALSATTVTPENESLLLNHHPCFENSTVSVYTHPSLSPVWVVTSNTTPTPCHWLSVAGRTVHLFNYPTHLPPPTPLPDPLPHTLLNPRHLLSDTHLKTLTTLFPHSIGCRVHLSGHLVLLYPTPSSAQYSRTLPTPPTFGGLQIRISHSPPVPIKTHGLFGLRLRLPVARTRNIKYRINKKLAHHIPRGAVEAFQEPEPAEGSSGMSSDGSESARPRQRRRQLLRHEVLSAKTLRLPPSSLPPASYMFAAASEESSSYGETDDDAPRSSGSESYFFHRNNVASSTDGSDIMSTGRSPSLAATAGDDSRVPSATSSVVDEDLSAEDADTFDGPIEMDDFEGSSTGSSAGGTPPSVFIVRPNLKRSRGSVMSTGSGQQSRKTARVAPDSAENSA